MKDFLRYFFFILILFIIFRYGIYLINMFKFPLMSKIFLFTILAGLSLFLFEKTDSNRRGLYLLLVGFVIFYILLTTIADLKGFEINLPNNHFMPRLTNYAIEEAIVQKYKNEDTSNLLSKYAPGWISNLYSSPKQFFGC